MVKECVSGGLYLSIFFFFIIQLFTIAVLSILVDRLRYDPFMET